MEGNDNKRLMGGTMVPNVVLYPLGVAFMSLAAAITAFFIQDRNRLAQAEKDIATLQRSDDIQDKNIANLMSMWSEVKRQLDRIEARMP